MLAASGLCEPSTARRAEASRGWHVGAAGRAYALGPSYADGVRRSAGLVALVLDCRNGSLRSFEFAVHRIQAVGDGVQFRGDLLTATGEIDDGRGELVEQGRSLTLEQTDLTLDCADTLRPLRLPGSATHNRARRPPC